MTKDNAGNYQQVLGVILQGGSYSPVNFDLGKNKKRASKNVVDLEKAWDAICQRWEKEKGTPEPCWDETTLGIAKALAMGQTEIAVDLPECFETVFGNHEWGEALYKVQVWLHQQRQLFPTIKITLSEEDMSGLSEDTVLSVMEETQEKIDRLTEELRHYQTILEIASEIKPFYVDGSILFRGKRHFLKMQSNSVIPPILEELQRLGWPETPIQLPPDLEGNIKQAIYLFNKSQILIRLHEQAGGTHVRWSRSD